MLFLQKTTLYSLFLFALLVLAAGCGEDDGLGGNNPGALENNSSARINVDGASINVDGLGVFALIDTTFVLPASSGDTTINYRYLYAAIASYTEEQLAGLMSIIIYNYDGPGVYQGNEADEYFPLAGLGYSSLNNESEGFGCLSENDQFEIVVTRDNGQVLEGTFSGTCSYGSEDNEISGSFTIRNP